MTEPSTKPLAEWTRNERVAYLATEVMGWHKGDGKFPAIQTPTSGGESKRTWYTKEGYIVAPCVTDSFSGEYAWDPFTDHNHAHMVEEKVMENQQLLSDYIWKITENINRDPKNPASTEAEIIWCMLKADLPTRMDAVIAAHQSLPSL